VLFCLRLQLAIAALSRSSLATTQGLRIKPTPGASAILFIAGTPHSAEPARYCSLMLRFQLSSILCSLILRYRGAPWRQRKACEYSLRLRLRLFSLLQALACGGAGSLLLPNASLADAPLRGSSLATTQGSRIQPTPSASAILFNADTRLRRSRLAIAR
jgi:hypothetical protein